MQQILNKLKDTVNEENFDIRKKEKKTNFVASMNSIGKILWWIQLVKKATTVQYPEGKNIL